MENCISTTVSSRLNVARSARKTGSIARLSSQLKRKSIRRRVLRISFVASNALLLSAVLLVVSHNRVSGASTLLSSAVSDEATTNPLDQVSSADIAVTVSRMSGLAESTAIKNQSESDDVQLTTATTTNNVVAKPQVSATSFKSNKDIKTYTAVAGDTIASIAAKFSVTSESIKWSNGISSDSVAAGTKLTIPPVGLSGIVYTVKAGDTIDSIAAKYSADKIQLIAANDAEISGIQPGEVIIVPNGRQPIAAAPRATASYSTSFAWGGSAIYGYNGYDYGYCTWYVANRLSVPANWGNANTWDNLAPLSGWTVSKIPRVGAVAQSNAGGEGHVGVVEAVSDDGSMIKYSDMNGLAGWGRVGSSDWVPTYSHFQNFIYQ
jgi:surface antigen